MAEVINPEYRDRFERASRSVESAVKLIRNWIGQNSSLAVILSKQCYSGGPKPYKLDPAYSVWIGSGDNTLVFTQGGTLLGVLIRTRVLLEKSHIGDKLC